MKNHLVRVVGLLMLLLMLVPSASVLAQPDPRDPDGDGFPDAINDNCPGVFGTNNGCPDTPPEDRDSDGDGTFDPQDRCPFDATNSCPEAQDTQGDQQPEQPQPDRDSDGDGIPDGRDGCPSTAGTNNGCPPADTDNDGFPDDSDRCPDRPGANNGCPLPTLPDDGRCQLATLSGERVNIRQHPYSGAEIVGQLSPSEVVPVLGALRTPEGVWYRIAGGWVFAEVVRLSSACDEPVPVADGGGRTTPCPIDPTTGQPLNPDPVTGQPCDPNTEPECVEVTTVTGIVVVTCEEDEPPASEVEDDTTGFIEPEDDTTGFIEPEDDTTGFIEPEDDTTGFIEPEDDTTGFIEPEDDTTGFIEPEDDTTGFIEPEDDTTGFIEPEDDTTGFIDPDEDGDTAETTDDSNIPERDNPRPSRCIDPATGRVVPCDGIVWGGRCPQGAICIGRGLQRPTPAPDACASFTGLVPMDTLGLVTTDFAWTMVSGTSYYTLSIYANLGGVGFPGQGSYLLEWRTGATIPLGLTSISLATGSSQLGLGSEFSWGVRAYNEAGQVICETPLYVVNYPNPLDQIEWGNPNTGCEVVGVNPLTSTAPGGVSFSWNILSQGYAFFQYASTLNIYNAEGDLLETVSVVPAKQTFLNLGFLAGQTSFSWQVTAAQIPAIATAATCTSPLYTVTLEDAPVVQPTERPVSPELCADFATIYPSNGEVMTIDEMLGLSGAFWLNPGAPFQWSAVPGDVMYQATLYDSGSNTWSHYPTTPDTSTYIYPISFIGDGLPHVYADDFDYWWDVVAYSASTGEELCRTAASPIVLDTSDPIAPVVNRVEVAGGGLGNIPVIELPNLNRNRPGRDVPIAFDPAWVCSNLTVMLMGDSPEGTGFHWFEIPGAYGYQINIFDAEQNLVESHIIQHGTTEWYYAQLGVDDDYYWNLQVLNANGHATCTSATYFVERDENNSGSGGGVTIIPIATIDLGITPAEDTAIFLPMNQRPGLQDRPLPFAERGIILQRQDRAIILQRQERAIILQLDADGNITEFGGQMFVLVQEADGFSLFSPTGALIGLLRPQENGGWEVSELAEGFITDGTAEGHLVIADAYGRVLELDAAGEVLQTNWGGIIIIGKQGSQLTFEVH